MQTNIFSSRHLCRSLTFPFSALVVAALTACGGGDGGHANDTSPVANCPAASNVTYRVVGLGGGFGKTTSTDLTKGTFNISWNDGSSEKDTISFSSSTACQFTVSVPSGTSSTTVDGAFASSGMFIVRDPGSSTSSSGLGIGIPEQAITLADLAGTWNFLEYSTNNSAGSWQNYQSLITLDASGNITANQDCTGSSVSNSCNSNQDSNSPSRISPNTDASATAGGFNVIAQDGTTLGARLFGFRNASGVLMAVISTSNSLGNRGMLIGAQQRTLTVPAPGTVNTFWDAQEQYSNLSSPSSFHLNQTTVQSVSGNTYTRIRNTIDGQVDGRVDSITVNQPRTGLRLRPSGSYVLNGVTRAFGNMVQMPISGMGFTVSTSTGAPLETQFLDFSVIKP
jgi:hypothetical protein